MNRRRIWWVSACLAAALAVPAVAHAQKLVLIVRHAERADGGSGSMGTDPPLSAEGIARAEKLAAMLADSGVKAVFATEFKRTQDTAKPLATKLGLAVQSTPAADPAALAAKLKASHASDIVLLVGHSNTMPAVIKALGGPVLTIGDNEYGDLYILVPATGTLTKIKF